MTNINKEKIKMLKWKMKKDKLLDDIIPERKRSLIDVCFEDKFGNTELSVMLWNDDNTFTKKGNLQYILRKNDFKNHNFKSMYKFLSKKLKEFIKKLDGDE